MLGNCKAGKFLSFHLLGTGKNKIVCKAVAYQSGGLFDSLVFFLNKVCFFSFVNEQLYTLIRRLLKVTQNFKILRLRDGHRQHFMFL